MRRPFLVRPAVAGALCGALPGAAGCAMPLGERTDRRLPGLPVVARQGDDGPVHRQRLVSVGADRVVLVEQVLADGRPPSRWRLTLDRRGTVLSRTALPTTTPLGANPPGHPLPATTGERTLGATRRGGTVRVTLAGDGHQAVLARLPDAGAVTLGQVVLGPGDPATLAVLPGAPATAPSRSRASRSSTCAGATPASRWRRGSPPTGAGTSRGPGTSSRRRRDAIPPTPTPPTTSPAPWCVWAGGPRPSPGSAGPSTWRPTASGASPPRTRIWTRSGAIPPSAASPARGRDGAPPVQARTDGGQCPTLDPNRGWR